MSTVATPGTIAERAAPSSELPASGASAPMAGPGARDAVTGRAAAVLAARCAACHGAHEPAAGLRADTPGALGEAQGGVRWVASGRPDESRLFEVVSTPSAAGRIAPKHRLSESEVEALRAWITSLPE